MTAIRGYRYQLVSYRALSMITALWSKEPSIPALTPFLCESSCIVRATSSCFSNNANAVANNKSCAPLTYEDNKPLVQDTSAMCTSYHRRWDHH
ncbi:hypothetical protein IF1G_04084 [Cordyceps javanica]|uniref:Uncharacterized protein n=1 Tax=Cordyceps javanica TaxID=43265 RepID=A0A545V552_9HYPO|nr:hypothetical protein IF1G_04084 [Cordyceps javanica]